MENDLINKDQNNVEEETDQLISSNRKMAPHGAVRFNKTLVMGTLLVLFILGVYTIHFSPNAKQSVVEKDHAEWLQQMKKDISSNVTDEKQSLTQSGILPDQSRVSMVLPADIPEDIHKAQTAEMPNRYIPERDSVQGMIRMELPDTESIENKPEYHAQSGDEGRFGKDADELDYSDKRNDEINSKITNNLALEMPESAQNIETGQMLQANSQSDTIQKQNEVLKTETGQIQQASSQTEIQQQQQASPQAEIKQIQQPGSQMEIKQNQQPGSQMEIQQIQQPGSQMEIQQIQQPGSQMEIKQIQQPGSQIEIKQIQQPGSQMDIEQIQQPGSQMEIKQIQQPGSQMEIQQMQQASSQSGFQQTTSQQTESQQMQQASSQTENQQIQQADSPQSEQMQQAVTQTNLDQTQQIGNYQKQISLSSTQTDELQMKPLTLMPEYNQNQNVPQFIQMALNRIQTTQPYLIQSRNPTVRPGYINQGNAPSYTLTLNSNVGQPPQYNGAEKPSGGVLNEPNRRLPGSYSQEGLLQYKQSIDGVRNDAYDPAKDTFTLASLIEGRMKLHKVLKNMENIVNYGSANSDDDNKKGWQWGEDKDEKHIYDETDKSSKFANLIMQVNKNAEPVTGTKPMRPPYKSRVEYPSYLTPINWKSSFEYVKAPVFECVPMRTLYYYIRVCIHPPLVKSAVSNALKAEASWEYNALRDMQIALFDYKDSLLIDIGASIGVFSLAAAALNRNVIAVEPYPSHIQVFKQSVFLNRFADHITLFQAVVSDHRGKVLIKRLGDHVDNFYIQTVEDDEPVTNYSLVVNAVTMDDIEKICPSRVAVLKLDAPGFVKKILEYSHYFFKYIYVTHVFMHWDTSDKNLCHFLVKFFVERGYQPYSDLRGKSSLLRIEEADYWIHDIVIWKL